MPSYSDIYKQFHSSKISLEQAFELVYEELLQKSNLVQSLTEEIKKLRETQPKENKKQDE